MMVNLNMENLDEKIDALAQNDEVIKLAEKLGTEPDRLAKWLALSVDVNMENVSAVITLLLDLMETSV